MNSDYENLAGFFEEFASFLDYLNKNDFAFWTLLMTVVIGLILFFWTLREISNWFLRTRSILKEQRELRQKLDKVSAHLERLEQNLQNFDVEPELKSPSAGPSASQPSATETEKTDRHFEVTH